MSVNKLSENFHVYCFYEDDSSGGPVQLPADGQAATTNHNKIGGVDFQECEKGLMLYLTIDGANAASTIRILSNSSTIGGGTDHVVTGTTITTPGNIDAAVETALLEWTASEVTDGDR